MSIRQLDIYKMDNTHHPEWSTNYLRQQLYQRSIDKQISVIIAGHTVNSHRLLVVQCTLSTRYRM